MPELANDISVSALEKNEGKANQSTDDVSMSAYGKLFADASPDLLNVKEGDPHKGEAAPRDLAETKIDKPSDKDPKQWLVLGDFPKGELKKDGSIEFD